MATSPSPVETLWCQHGAGHEWLRPRVRGAKPRRCPLHGGRKVPYTDADETRCTPVASMYSLALQVALDPAEDPRARAAAGNLMRELAGDMRRPEQDGGRGAGDVGGLRDLICGAIDQRIYGPAHLL